MSRVALIALFGLSAGLVRSTAWKPSFARKPPGHRTSAASHKLPEDVAGMLERLTQVGNAHGANWATMGGAFQVNQQVLALLQLGKSASKDDSVGTVCEVGFNAGHSAAALLWQNNATLLEFDVQALPYSAACLETVRERFPDRVRMYTGDSLVTLPKHLKKVEHAASSFFQRGTVKLCDRFFIDGAHNNPVVASDFTHAMKLTRAGGLVMADDATSRFPDVPLEWKKLVAQGYIADSKCSVYDLPPPAGLKGFCIGRRTEKKM